MLYDVHVMFTVMMLLKLVTMLIILRIKLQTFLRIVIFWTNIHPCLNEDYDHSDLAPLISNAVDDQASEDGEGLKHLC